MDFSFLSGIFASPWNVFRSLLDIVIVAYIFYRLLGLIRGTRAEQLLKGLLILLVFSAVVSYLRLDMLNWLLDKIWLLFAITIPIVFQPELRRILEQLGRGSFFASTYHQEKEMETGESVIKEICAAVTVLSRTRTGALMILVRETGIGEYLESGIVLDSLVSAGLLINIFVPNTPLHDGALIIQEGRLKKAACFLPLTNNPALDPGLGTRHRAGLGITEESDALAVIVSEETGTVSVAREGKLIRYLDAKSLKELLEKEMLTREGHRESFWNWRRWAQDEHKTEEDDRA